MSRLERELEKIYEDIGGNIFNLAAEFNFTDPVTGQPGGTWQQRNLFQAVQDGHQRIAVRSGKGPGKTASSCVVGAFWVLQDRDILLPITAPTMRQCRDVWLKTFWKMQQEARPWVRKYFEVFGNRIVIAGSKYWAIVPITATNQTAAQGMHDKKLKVIVEEASGVERPILEAFESTITNKGGAMLWIGNPNTNDCGFHDCFSIDAHRWKTMAWNAEETARDYPMLIDPEKVAYEAEKYGRTSDYYRVNVQGNFPLSDPRCMMSMDDLMACVDLPLYEMARKNRPGADEPARQYGVDVARFGDAESCVIVRQGEAVVEMRAFQKTDPNDVLDWATRDCLVTRQWDPQKSWFVIDAGGMGQGIMRRMHDARFQVYEFLFGRRLSGKEYFDEQTRAWFQLSKKVREHDVRLPRDPRLFQQLSQRQYGVHEKTGQLQIESKQHYCDRGFESPDRADALVMAMYDRMDVGMRKTGEAPGAMLGAALRGE